MIIKPRRVIVKGVFSGEALVSPKPISFLGDVDKESGRVSNPHHPLNGYTLRDKVLVLPSSVGSSVGSYVIIALRKRLRAPRAVVVGKADIVLASGCGLAGIPLVEVGHDSFRRILGLAESCERVWATSTSDMWSLIFSCTKA